MKLKKTFVEQIRLAYDKAKKPLAYIIIISILCLEILSRMSIIPSEIKHQIELTLIVVITMLLMEILFSIYDKVVEDKGHLKVIKPNKLYDEILNLVKTGKKVKIQYIGVAGRFGWYSVLSQLLDKACDDSLHDADEFNLEVALIAPQFYEDNKATLRKFSAVSSAIENIEQTQEQLENLYKSDIQKKPSGDQRGIAELTVFYCESCINFLGYCGMDDEGYFNALILMFEQALNASQSLDVKQQASTVERLKVLQHEGHNWGIGDEIEDMMAEYGFNET